ncbi:D-alanyl-D-alanine carboxypeptidase/D-alanyl-D-alanine endopeptidase [Bacteroides thetaiotaomicron]|jgi:D-alanyl-D-alanine carboxypeptidase/D-alanyl-D-alanine-endopeptidase|uniref:D-alanyl-D-alanine carboxypeptidase/D-alanyl-D-alanine endopeptidase n=1 Tax=Bacteroides thetaiotaomicron TaxID=818 RepID=UPI0008A00E52|nr:D-alanyl-D-alanine carboxypeptidase/D-alanyl-D-alanine-endopeptidase [Bacteroides thetaiotaomicron]MBL3917740.1 D-alanyl-D-alanine carboxypeptidase/D-alanyl-D-alanine-endopeptidase [Bacteroides thetaiotaomicron]MBL3934627.1 D-alanyl-D-alanine carboxypeptidase/D-alanyl-D-alanine-endopeptidase [Bacteroides thetaiotaomicron]MBL3942040.1 D-alanyl-D-alanine carboxypeptidase/D-alanyl-D-alanine-endopeptidase [Bacteroides thetaiotaomicron]MBL3946736.1 D-alanyl-D-alanine carboxypeptidase/D-alanyl-D-a
MKKYLLFLVLSVALLPASVWGQANLSQIDSLIKRMLPEASEVGISVYDLTAKKSLYTYRDTKLSRPASTMKLLTAITALSRPDADNPFRTEVWHDGVIEHDTLQGNLYVVGGFDPEFDSLMMDSLIEEVITFPFSVINGQVYGDVSMKDSLYWGHGWAWDDTPEAYQPYMSPLMFCKGAVEVTVVPGSLQGDTASVSCKPVSSYYTLTNRTKTRTPSAGKYSLSRDWLTNGNNLIVTGNVPTFRKDLINIYDSGSFFMHTFLERLRAKGIVVPESYGFTELPSDGAEQMARWETPVQKVLNQLMKESDNLNAEAMLCRIASQATGKKRVTAEDGIVEIMKLVRNLGHDPKDYKIADGCGLSNYNYLSPALLVDFLKYAYSQSDVFQKLYKSLPVAGIDGTLKNRMKNTPAFRNVHAKTGSFTAINALAGYLKMKNGHTLAFAIMNQNVLSAAKARAFQDKVCEVIIGH